MTDDVDDRPENCRNRLRDEGQAYPKSGCESCGNGGRFGCPYEGEREIDEKVAGTHYLLTISYNVRIKGLEGMVIRERTATILTAKKPWEYLLDPDIERDRDAPAYVTMIHNVTEIPPFSLTMEQVEKLRERG